MYVTYDYYTTTYGGSTISSLDFNKYERKARITLDNFTFDRLKSNNDLIDDTVKECLCDMMECNYKLDQQEAETDGKIIASESVDGHNVTYAVSDAEKNQIDKSKITKLKLYNIAKDYLGNTALMYRGIDYAN
ncbi:hypothetical protein CLSAB_19370 [Clostridium saccharobutylicum]|uniref:hypothetical protein n=1 Tax=Clostridium saccharobutylicum TaxID=169679 RepID=UPI00098CBA25|nr:hypothetical protein [Clostridium saccharobutylicum]OOM17217.1 hypothetical protein CLSAB_19370 [Clostridium saccharobutylicum]